MSNNKIRFNRELMQQVLDSFSTFTGVRATFDCGEVILYGNGQRLSGFCTELRRMPCYQARCLRCDAEAKAEAARRGDLYVYKCHMGFWEAIAPLRIHGEIAAYLTIGQIVDRADSDTVFSRIREVLERDGVDPAGVAALEEQFHHLKVFTCQEVEAGANLLRIMGEYLSYQRVVDVRYGTMIERVTEYLNQNFAHAITSAEIEAAAQYRYTYVCDLFKRETGSTITQYLEHRRMEYAARLLAETSLRIYEISERCGYRNHYYFSRLFRRKFQCTPQQYRRRAAEQEPPPIE